MITGVFKSKESFLKEFKTRLTSTYLKDVKESTVRERYNILGTLVREEISKDWIKTNKQLDKHDQKKVYYFSMEFLMGRLITNNLMNMGIRDTVEAAFNELGLDLNEVEHYESDPGLGNGGLGRLAACYLDSMASLGIPGYGHCIRYRYGLFRQKINDGYQEERPDNWLSDGYVWEIRKQEEAVDVPFFGYVDYQDEKGFVYKPNEYIKAVPYDVPIVGDGNGVVNYLRLWNAEPSARYPEGKSPFDYEAELEKISGILYPDDTTYEGKQLRLKQQYFFTSAGVKSITNRHFRQHKTLKNLSDYVVFHINDTHPTLIIPELMRILLDEHHMEWDDAWKIVTETTAYTNHTILAEALEKWPVDIMKPLLPRIFQLIEEINRRFTMGLLEKYGYAKLDLINKLSIVQDGLVKMANLCIVSGFSVNGVAKLHTEILKHIEMKDWFELYPEKFTNVTNGITHRRWLLHSNKELTALIESAIGPDFKKDTFQLERLLPFANDKTFQQNFLKVKQAKKQQLANRIHKEQGITLDTNSIFDIQVKRLHEYKRQLMNALHIMSVYNQLKNDESFRNNYHPHTFIFGAKAAGAYYFAKKIIKLINTIAEKVNNDEETNKYLKVIFVENYNVSYAEMIMPAADISEQISTASKEASGTGNMKFMMNGALTLGTLDGANVEINELVDSENIFIFGMDSEEVNEVYKNGGYDSQEIYQNDPELHLVLEQLINGFFEKEDREEFRDIFSNLVYSDHYFVLKDYHAYKVAHEQANEAYKNASEWAKKAIVNIAKSGIFASDRSIQEYADHIWHVKPMK
ncbi:MAG: glycogen/starch/alpha-glucan phosphorylase [Bacilli bacterium]|nr:glycogen/starch/alpha-glucan phosphorylase [Bacilli bacterium]MBN2876038.1 glycogen/starch/alpha-glucan phosphorylase [Bacilli bacterium]